MSSATLRVTSEIGTLRRLLVHSPDSSLGKVVPSKAQDWLFEDIVHLDTIRRKEYDFYTRILLYFLDPARIQGKLTTIDDPRNGRAFFKPCHDDFHRSENVIELQWLLADILADTSIRLRLVASVCAIEFCSYETQNNLFALEPRELSKVLISGILHDGRMLFPPIPNFIFTRDIGVVINDHILLNRPAKKARTREALLTKYIFFNHPLFTTFRDKILEIEDTSYHFLMPKDTDEKKVTLEGGDVMMITPRHLLLGISERTTVEAAHQVINLLFARQIVDTITVIRIPKKRDYMHIDTVFTQVKRNVWVMLGNFSRTNIRKENADPIERILESKKKDDPVRITQFHRHAPESPVSFDSLEDLLINISENELMSPEKTVFIYSGNNEFPYDVREQWTDSCNVLALREGVVLGYDRNDKTTEAFRAAGFSVITAEALLASLEAGTLQPATLRDTLIVMPSAELSRARGGFHCMSLPLWREDLTHQS
ncbi:amidinotransferase [Fulvivirgaceae bacterium PWU5]|uniref:arginine deiminase n=1 Tax=Dawidia cretensis TaxID=2782350 RepID=A0AAP2E2J2_9BACT|nr:arginine deiminase family protein [Dawidia cretensis]MBT1711905.1 amidinotransferase [Dawidia cretensis]